MSAQVKLSLKAARALLRDQPVLGTYNSAHWLELERAVDKALRSSSTRRKLRAPKAEKRASRREETSAIRAAVVARANGRCEACGGNFRLYPAEMDHAWGRGKAKQSVKNCWLLCKECHRSKTDGEGGRGYWLRVFEQHALQHGYIDEASKASREQAWAASKAATR